MKGIRRCHLDAMTYVVAPVGAAAGPRAAGSFRGVVLDGAIDGHVRSWGGPTGGGRCPLSWPGGKLRGRCPFSARGRGAWRARRRLTGILGPVLHQLALLAR